MSHSSDTDQAQRVRQARQVLAGSDVRPPPDPWSYGADEGGLNSTQRNYLIALVALLLLGVVLSVFLGLVIGSVVLFVLALGLIAAWLIF